MKKILPLTALLLSACGTLFTGTTQNVSFNSKQQGLLNSTSEISFVQAVLE